MLIGSLIRLVSLGPSSGEVRLNKPHPIIVRKGHTDVLDVNSGIGVDLAEKTALVAIWTGKRWSVEVFAIEEEPPHRILDRTADLCRRFDRLYRAHSGEADLSVGREYVVAQVFHLRMQLSKLCAGYLCPNDDEYRALLASCLDSLTDLELLLRALCREWSDRGGSSECSDGRSVVSHDTVKAHDTTQGDLHGHDSALQVRAADTRTAR